MAIYYWKDVQGYEPNEDTLAYFNIDDDDSNSTVYDKSIWGHNATWYWTAWYETLSSWKRVLVFSWSNWLYLDTKLITQQPYTINMRVLKNGNQWNDATMISNQYDSWNYWQVIAYNGSNQVYTFYGNGSGSWLTTGDVVTFTNWVWTQYLITVDQNTIKKYKDWQLVQTVNNSQWPVFANSSVLSIWFLRTQWTQSNFRFFNWKMSDIFVETWARDATQESEYFEVTKSLYGY